jgi:hypothetical protein
MEILCVSYAQDLADKLSPDCRRILASDWYRQVFAMGLQLRRVPVRDRAAGTRLAARSTERLDHQGPLWILFNSRWTNGPNPAFQQLQSV